MNQKQKNMNYNTYALNKLSEAERDHFAEFMPPGIHYKVAGEEYEDQDWDAEILNDFVLDTSGKISIICGLNFATFYEKFKAFDKVERIYYRNEIWHEITDWKYIRKNLREYIFQREKYYRRHAAAYVSQAFGLIDFMRAKGIEIDVVLNVPLAQNKYLRAFLNEVGDKWNGKVSIHIYGKWEEPTYFEKLQGWIDEIKGKNFSKIICGEMNGLFNHAKGRELKNSNLHKEYHKRIFDLLHANGIDEIYYFTLVANQTMMNWRNPPIYNRFFVTENSVVDTVANVFQ